MNVAITIIKMIGGLVLLIYGMNLLSTNLKKLAGEKFERILKKATDNIFKGLLTGILITVALQSSAATTVMVVGFVNAGILKLKNSIPIIMGANIGTTITAQILRLASVGENTIVSLISPSTLAPMFLLIGLIFMEIKKKKKFRDIGQLLVGIGLLFTGLMTMVDMASSFSELPILTTILTKLSNPILGVLAGAFITVIVQSSAAAVGILQAISTTGFTTFSSTIPIILGQNIGTCFTSILSSIGASKNAKRTAAVHLYFNLIGTILFMIFIYTYQYVIGFSFWNDPIDMGGIANFHLVFNIVSTLILLPCTGLLEKLTLCTIKDTKKTNDDDDDVNDYISILSTLDQRITNIPSVAIGNSMDVIYKMGELSEKNFRKAVKLIDNFDPKKLEHIQEREDAIDKMDIAVANFLVKVDNLDISDQENQNITMLLKIESEYEKIGDYSFKIAKLVENIKEKDLTFSNTADKNLKVMYNIVEDALIKTLDILKNKDKNSVIEIEVIREVADSFKEKYRTKHIERLKQGKCSVENGIAFIEILSAYEKIISHCVNISIASLNVFGDYITKHEYLDFIYLNEEDLLISKKKEYNEKYKVLELDNKLNIV